MVTLNQLHLGANGQHFFSISKTNFKYIFTHKEGFLTGISHMCNFSSFLVTECIIYLVEKKMGKEHTCPFATWLLDKSY